MAEDLLKKGFDNLFDPQYKFDSDRAYSKFIYYAAWGVEILASMIGLFFAWSTGFNAYVQLDERTTQTFIYAFQGALPFILIAIIEPLKIPLAAGLYKVKIFGWKILIGCALLGLTVITFETMFTSLEQNLTNITTSVVKQDNTINRLNGRLIELAEQKKKILEKNDNQISDEIKSQVKTLQQERNSKILEIQNQLKVAVDPLKQKNNNLKVQLSGLTASVSSSEKERIQLLKDQINLSKITINDLKAERDREVENYKSKFTNEKDKNDESIYNQISNLEKNNANFNLQKQDLEKQLQQLLKDTRLQISELDKNYNEKITQLQTDKKNEIDRLTIFQSSTPINNKYSLIIESEKTAYEDQKSSLQSEENQTKQRLLKDIDAANKSIELNKNNIIDLQNKIKPVGSFDNSQIKKINRNYQQKIDAEEIKLQKTNQDLTQLVDNLSSSTKSKINQINAEIKILEDNIIDLTNKADKEIDQIKRDYNPRIKSLNENEEKMILINSNKRNKEIPKIENETDKINSEITKAKDEKRIKAQRSSVYRFAAWYYSVPDIVDVKKEQLDFVAFIWFGSIAIVAATMGTILALIHYIVDDPENYKPRQKINFTKRIIVTLLLFIRRVTHLVKSLIRMLLSFSRLILSFAEIFRGLIGKPIQRSFRNLFVAFRKRLNKPKIKIHEKIVEKEVKIEVEKPVEKEVIKEVEVIREVPVERVEITEVPREIVRKELVYVPLYSSEGGLVNAPENVRNNEDND